MTRLGWAIVCTGLLAGTTAAGDVDLTKIDRAIRKEPAYTSKAPKYGLLVFGPEAKARVWLVLDGNTLYVDRNQDGDLTGADEKVAVPDFKPDGSPFHEGTREAVVGDIKDGDAGHAKLTFSQLKYRKKLPDGVDKAKVEEWQAYLDKNHRQTGDGVTYSISVELSMKGAAKPVNWFAWLDNGGQLVFGKSPKEAPVIHFGGPLTMLSNPGNKLSHAPGPDDRFTVHIGTAGVGAGSFAYMCHDNVPQGVHPVLEIEFPPKMPGGPAVLERYDLKERC
jgi:hypothetical protein